MSKSEGHNRPPTPAPPPSASDVAVIAALPIELGPFLSRLRERRKFSAGALTVVEGTIGSRVVVALASGPGQKAARKAASLVMAGHRPRWILSVGFAGALARELARNRIIIPGQILNQFGGRIRIDVGGCGGVLGAWADPACLLTVDSIVRTATEKASLRQETSADAVDMESYAVAELCAEHLTRFLSVRVISDDSQTNLPPELLTLVGPTGGYRIGAAVGALLKRPTSLATMLQLREHGHQAAEALSKALEPLILALK